MNQESLVYGYIKTIPCFDRAEARAQASTNRAVLAALSSANGRALLNPDMFSIPPSRQGDESGLPAIIHFGQSYDGIEYEWNLWMKQFEALLQAMTWQSATVHLQTELSGSHSFVWEADGDGHTPGAAALNVRCEWNHELGLFDSC